MAEQKNLEKAPSYSVSECLEKAETFIQSQKLPLAIDILEKTLANHPENLNLLSKTAETHYMLKDYKKAQEMNNKAIQILSEMNERSEYSEDINNLIVNSYWLAMKIDEILSSSSKLFETLENLKKTMDKYPTSRRDEINKEINRISQMYQSKNSFRSKVLDLRKKEAKTVFDLIEIANDNHLLSEEALPCNIISAKWFNKWKKFSFFHILSGEKIESEEGNEIEDGIDFGEETSGEGTPSISKNTKNWPGPIDVSDLLDNSEEILCDPDKIKSYCNYNLKRNLEENKDFIIIPHNVFKYLHRIYGGEDLKRYVVFINDDTNLTHVEIWLKKINFVVYPILTGNEMKIYKTFLSKKETVKDLKEKLFRIFSEKYASFDIKFKEAKNCKIWKLDSTKYSLENLQNLLVKNAKIDLINCKKLEDKISLEDCEVSEEDIVLVEYKTGEDWIFTSEKEKKLTDANQCANCHAAKRNLQYCICMQVKYCDMECLKMHRVAHKPFCKPKEPGESFISTVRNQSLQIKFNRQENKGLTGLQNLGNTCFMNSSLQCLSNTYELTYYFLSDAYHIDINKKNPLGSKGYLAMSFADLVKSLWRGSESYVSPWSLKKIIGRLAPQFSGYNQQDSQELLYYLLDGLHEDLNKIKKKPVLPSLDYKNQPDEEFSVESWNHYLKRNRSIIIDLFAGQYKSKVTCPTCNRISITFDPYLSVSLPIPHISHINFQFYFVPREPSIPPQKIKMILPSSETSAEFLHRLAELTKIKEQFLLIALVKEHKIIEYPHDNYDIKYLERHEGITFVFEVCNEKYDSNINLEEKVWHFEINVNQKSRKEKYYDNSVSFTRVLKLPAAVTLEEIHLKIYKMFRVYLNNFYTALPPETKKDYPIDLNAKNDEEIKTEFEFMFSQENKFAPPYEITYFSENNQKIMLEYSKSDFLASLGEGFSEKEFFFELNLNINSTIKIELLKLNKCQEANFENNGSNDTKLCTLHQCLDQFIKEETLDPNNAWYCSHCKKHQQARKKIELYTAPDLLILHLKRFKNSSGSFYMSSGTSKITKFVDFPLEGLNLNDYILGKKDENMIYDLYAVSNHYGGLCGGHYTACAKNYFDKKWYEFNDSSVHEVSPSRIISEAAYVLFYRRRREISDESLSQSYRESRKN